MVFVLQISSRDHLLSERYALTLSVTAALRAAVRVAEGPFWKRPPSRNNTTSDSRVQNAVPSIAHIGQASDAKPIPGVYRFGIPLYAVKLRNFMLGTGRDLYANLRPH